MRPLSVLVVEDERVLRQAIECHLKERGHRVYSAWSVEGALKSLRVERDIDVVILDMMLDGEGDGGGLRIAGRTPRDTPIIVISGYDEESIRAEAARNPLMGVVRWIAKPFRMADVSSVLEELPGRPSTYPPPND
jgi:two-component system, OmpR family, response regulator VicR